MREEHRIIVMDDARGRKPVESWLLASDKVSRFHRRAMLSGKDANRLCAASREVRAGQKVSKSDAGAGSLLRRLCRKSRVCAWGYLLWSMSLVMHGVISGPILVLVSHSLVTLQGKQESIDTLLACHRVTLRFLSFIIAGGREMRKLNSRRSSCN
jgi:hypothetical protein